MQKNVRRFGGLQLNLPTTDFNVRSPATVVKHYQSFVGVSNSTLNPLSLNREIKQPFVHALERPRMKLDGTTAGGPLSSGFKLLGASNTLAVQNQLAGLNPFRAWNFRI